jgi:ABC-type phosphate transport system substrate-binding protein
VVRIKTAVLVVLWVALLGLVPSAAIAASGPIDAGPSGATSAAPTSGPSGPTGPTGSHLTLTVAPADDLVSGQYVSARWAGAPSEAEVQLRQCTVDAVDYTGCSFLPVAGATSDASGRGSVSFPVEGQVNLGSDGQADASTFRCDDHHACRIAAFTDPDASDLNTAAFATLSFAPSVETCAASTSSASTTASANPSPSASAAPTPSASPSSTPTPSPSPSPSASPSPSPSPSGASGASSPAPVDGLGAPAGFRAMDGWLGVLCRPPHDLEVTYGSTNSIRAEKAFKSGSADFTLVSQPFEDRTVASLNKQGRTFTYAPVLTSGLVFAYRMFDPTTGEQITDLQLTARQIAAIFTGQLVDLNEDLHVVMQNASTAFPTKLHAIGVAGRSAETELLTSWLMADARATYYDGGRAFRAAGVTETYPDPGAIQLVRGPLAVGRAVAEPPADAAVSDGFIGWMDSSVAAYFGLPTVSLRNAAGLFVDPTRASIAAGVRTMHRNRDGTRSPRFGTHDGWGNAYPLSVVSYLVAQTNVAGSFDGTEGRPIKTLLRYAIGPGQGSLAGGYGPLTANLQKASAAALNEIPTTAATSPSPSPTPQPTPTPSPTTTAQAAPPSPVTTPAPQVQGAVVTPAPAVAPPVVSPAPSLTPPVSPSPTVPPVATASPVPGAVAPVPVTVPSEIAPVISASSVRSDGSGIVWPAIVLTGVMCIALGSAIGGPIALFRRRRRRRRRDRSAAEVETNQVWLKTASERA